MTEICVWFKGDLAVSWRSLGLVLTVDLGCSKQDGGVSLVAIPSFVLRNIFQVSGDFGVDDGSLLDYVIKQEREQRQLNIQQRHIVHPIVAQVHNVFKIQINNNV